MNVIQPIRRQEFLYKLYNFCYKHLRSHTQIIYHIFIFTEHVEKISKRPKESRKGLSPNLRKKLHLIYQQTESNKQKQIKFTLPILPYPPWNKIYNTSAHHLISNPSILQRVILWYYVCKPPSNQPQQGRSQTFQNEGAARGAQGWAGGWLGLKKAALHRPLYIV